MHGTPNRLLVALLALLVAVGSAACGGDDDDDRDDTGSASSTTSTTGGTGSGTTDEDGSTTTTAAGGSTSASPSTTAAGGPTTTAALSGSQVDRVIEVTIAGGNVEGGVRREKVALGSEVTIRVTSDVADELHVHTYDLRVDLVPGQSADLTFLARIPGVFEVELEERHKKVLDLEVSG